jgi:hypothetical protein
MTVCLMMSTAVTYATHIRAGEIRAERISCSTFTYKITLIVFTNTESPTHPGGWFGGGMLRWGEGSAQVPHTAASVVSAELDIGRAVYTRDVTFSREGTFIISFEEAHRNVAILNVPNQNDDINFYVEDQLVVSSKFCDSTPSFLVYPIDEACKGQVFYHNPGASDADGDSLSYSFTTPKGNGGNVISGYTDPNNIKFYAGLDYSKANSAQNGPPTFAIDPATGLVTWDAPGQIGSYNIAIKVSQWKYNPADSTWLPFGFAVRDMQISVQGCPNHPPTIGAVADVCVVAGEWFTLNVTGSDPDMDPVIMEVFSAITSFSESPPIIQYAGVVQSEDTAHLKIKWQPDCLRVREQPYQVVVKITDAPINGGVKLSSFKTINIKVMGPPPDITDVQVNPVTKKVTLQWSPYVCDNAELIQVWRRVSERKYTQPQCEVGMQKSLQYALLTELPGNATTYVDSDLAIGAQYCYRIVARFGEVGSKISLDTCLIPKPAEAPVITNVTVKKTDDTNGEIGISWLPPFEIDQTQYPPQYKYAVQRGNGFQGGDWTTITSEPIYDTTFVDSNIPTTDTTYHYRILLYVPTITDQIVDTSSVASSVKLRSIGLAARIELTWDAVVPWSNFLEHYPYHYIYRSASGVEGPFVLIDSVDVNQTGLEYVDEGKFQNAGLDDHTIYYYKVETLGGYGNPSIEEPLINFSQVVFNHLIDITPPCPPILTIIKPDCDDLPCLPTYANTINWKNSTANGCQDDVVYYEVQVAENLDAEFVSLNGHVEVLTVVQAGLKDLAVCYKVRAVDWMGNVSEWSDVVCGENCPAFNMPNVFTPDESKNFNDTFRAFSATGNILNNECSRFIDYMSLMIVNRAGKEIMSASSSDIEKVYWDGKDKEGRNMPSGVYYFIADVRLKYSLEKLETKQIRGWVMLVR